jgi:hypothetical protein
MLGLYGGSLKHFPNNTDGFADSMAEEIEKAYDEALAEAGFPLLPDPLTANPDDLKNRRILFIAIARGVINHLKKKESAFLLAVDESAHTHIAGSGGEHAHGAHATIQVKLLP